MFGAFKKRRESGDFWTWLAANTERLQGGGAEGFGRFADALSKAFEKSYPDLVWEITPSDSGPWGFCVSADGTPELFDQVRAAVAAAPALSGWEISAFRQRGSLDAEINMDGRTLGYDDIWCEVEPDGCKARVTLCVRGLTLETAETLLGAALVLLDNAVGEHDAVVKISDLNNAPLPQNPVRSPAFFPLSQLPAYLDRLGDSRSAGRAARP